MNLLLVEDETLTRTSIREEIDWRSFGIERLEEASDGLEALAVMERFVPDILITDIKMPRMDGIELARHVRRKHPKSMIILISGYAEKEYFKSAISLKAVRYVEKPIDLEELEEALKSAVAYYLEQDRLMQASRQLAQASPYLMEKAAMQLSRFGLDEELAGQLELIGLPVANIAESAACLIRFTGPPPAEREVSSLLSDMPGLERLNFLFVFKDEQHLMLQLFAMGSRVLEPEAGRVLAEVCAALKARRYCFAAAMGEIHPGLDRMRESYISAAYRLQAAFYRGVFAILDGNLPATAGEEPFELTRARRSEFREALMNEQFRQVRYLVQTWVAEIKRTCRPEEGRVKEMLYQLLEEADRIAAERGIELRGEGNPRVWEQFANYPYLQDLERVVMRSIGQFEQIAATRASAGTVSRVLRYIHDHYAEEALSVQAIAEDFNMTASYLIMIFRQANGSTIRQYITDYRVAKAKELLRSPRMKVADVAGLVGYRDSEYFSKIFRKHTGLTPSQFKERCRS